jgi:hypothetical protein
MKTRTRNLVYLFLGACAFGILVNGQTSKPPAQPPPPVYNAPPRSPQDAVVTAVPVKQQVIVTNAVPVTNIILVTNVVEVTNIVLVTNPLAFSYDQSLYARPVLVTPDQAKIVLDRFKQAYPKLGKPRFLIYVNRELIDQKSGLKLDKKTTKIETVQGSLVTHVTASSASNNEAITLQGNVQLPGNGTANEIKIAPGKGSLKTETKKTVVENAFQNQPAQELSLADRQTVRDVERLFGRPLRLGGATIVDQKIATQLIGPVKSMLEDHESEQAKKDREAVLKIADAVVEVLISSRSVTVPTVSGDKTLLIPDIQATAISLKDSKIIGQASSSDILGKQQSFTNFDVRDVTEATALALMEDIALGVIQNASDSSTPTR